MSNDKNALCWILCASTTNYSQRHGRSSHTYPMNHWRNWELIKCSRFSCIVRILYFDEYILVRSIIIWPDFLWFVKRMKKSDEHQTRTFKRFMSWCHKHRKFDTINTIKFRFCLILLWVGSFVVSLFLFLFFLNSLTSEVELMRGSQIPLINLNSMNFENRTVSWPKSFEIYFNWMIPQSAKRWLESKFNFTLNNAFLLTKLTRVSFAIHFIQYLLLANCCSIEFISSLISLIELE